MPIPTGPLGNPCSYKLPVAKTDFYAESDKMNFHPGFNACSDCGGPTNEIDTDDPTALCAECE